MNAVDRAANGPFLTILRKPFSFFVATGYNAAVPDGGRFSSIFFHVLWKSGAASGTVTHPFGCRFDTFDSVVRCSDGPPSVADAIDLNSSFQNNDSLGASCADGDV